MKVGDVEGVQVLQDNQVIGRTDSAGKLFVPDMRAYYDNVIAINDRDIPIDYSISRFIKFISPPLRSGSCIVFDVARLHPVAGRLVVEVNGEVKPLEYAAVTMPVNGRDIAFQTGTNGEFYFDADSIGLSRAGSPGENGCTALSDAASSWLPPGIYRASATHIGKVYQFEITIPKPNGFLDLGTIRVHGTPTSGSGLGR